jgi:hypothetical protein
MQDPQDAVQEWPVVVNRMAAAVIVWQQGDKTSYCASGSAWRFVVMLLWLS